jgi:hypothetical protein
MVDTVLPREPLHGRPVEPGAAELSLDRRFLERREVDEPPALVDGRDRPERR